MIEPHSAQLGASSWILKATFALPSDSVTVPDPFPFDAFAGAAWPLVATTASSSRAGEEAPLEAEPAVVTEEFAPLDAPTFGVPAARSEEPVPTDVASSLNEGVVSTANALGASLRASFDAPGSA